jgi:hypothetical protein
MVARMTGSFGHWFGSIKRTAIAATSGLYQLIVH